VVGTYSKDSVNYVKVKGLVRNDSRSEVEGLVNNGKGREHKVPNLSRRTMIPLGH
jgi:hypothetical protein